MILQVDFSKVIYCTAQRTHVFLLRLTFTLSTRDDTDISLSQFKTSTHLFQDQESLLLKPHKFTVTVFLFCE